MLSAENPVNTLGRALKAQYGHPLRRVMLDLGLTCPNRDGASGFGGCIYCDVHGSGTGQAQRRPLLSQFDREMERVRRIIPAGPAAIAYLQSYSNTYPDLEPLEKALEELTTRRAEAPIVSVGTRPDCFSLEAARLLGKYRETFNEVWIEFGLETADDNVQRQIGRNDSLESFHRACELAHSQGLKIVCHTIAGLPGDSPEGLLRQVEESTVARVHGIKFHQLMVLRRTKLETMWKRGRVKLLEPAQYVGMVADALERLPASIVVHRLVAEAPEDVYLAPQGWPTRAKVHSMIEQGCTKRGTLQGGARIGAAV